MQEPFHFGIEHSERTFCVVCGNVNPKKRYGALSCNACLSFFRRIVKKNQPLHKCPYDEKCNINYDTRSFCRSCRYDQCLEVGMRPQAVQCERDKYAQRKTVVNERPTSFSNCGSFSTSPTLKLVLKRPTPNLPSDIIAKCSNSMSTLQNLDIALKQDANVDLLALNNPNYEATAAALLYPQLSILVECYKCLNNFCALPLRNQTSLLRAFAPQSVFLEDLNRSRHLDNKLLLYGGKHMVELAQPDPYRPEILTHVNAQLVTQLLPQFKSLNLNNVEYHLLKSIAFWNPDVCSSNTVQQVLENRNLHLVVLEQYLSSRPNNADSAGRHGQIIMFLSTLERLAANFRQSVLEWQTPPPVLVRDLFVKEDSFPHHTFYAEKRSCVFQKY